jgi:hypothetical protein
MVHLARLPLTRGCFHKPVKKTPQTYVYRGPNAYLVGKSISSRLPDEAPDSPFFIQTVLFGLAAPPVPRFLLDLGLHPSGESRPSLAPWGALGDSRREKKGMGPLCRRENTRTPLSCRKSPSPRCSVAAATTPRQSVGRLPALRRPASHQPIFCRLACRLPIFRRRATPPIAPHQHARQVFVHFLERTWTRTTRRSRCLPSFLKKRW